MKFPLLWNKFKELFMSEEEFQEVLINYSTDPNVISFDFKSYLGAYECLNFSAKRDIVDLVVKLGVSTNSINTFVLMRKLNWIIDKNSASGCEADYIYGLACDEIENIRNVRKTYMQNMKTGHFPFELRSFNANSIVMIKANLHDLR